MNWFLGLFFLGLLLLFFYWLLVITEGVYLGRKVVIWMYDLTADGYDRIKEFDYYFEHGAIVGPLLKNLAHLPEPSILDVATGTGRVPLLLLREDQFNGRVIGLDASSKMLAHGMAKLSSLPPDRQNRLTLIRQSAGKLPFQDNSFDVVTCLEALEFFPSDEGALNEMARVLKPGGYLLTSRRQGWEAHLFFGRYRSRHKLAKMLNQLGFTNVEYYPWQVNYDMVTALKMTR